MIEKASKKQKKGSVSEEDVASLLQRSLSSFSHSQNSSFFSIIKVYGVFFFFSFCEFSRYTPTTVLTLLHEVASCTDVKIDWNVLVEKSSTGISNAREYQMLWRHIAYSHSFLEKFEDGAQPLVSFLAFSFEFN